MSAYEGLARYYDGLTADVDYRQWLNWYELWFARSAVPVKIVLDVACGTGTLTCMLAERGYSMIGTDLSYAMLSEAMEKAQNLTCERPLFLHQPMDQLDMFGTVDACVSSLDSINYVTDQEILRRAFQKIHCFLMPGGWFLFDVIAPEWLKKLDGQVFVDENPDVFCVWRAAFDEARQVLTYGMDLFEREDEVWYREQEEHQERAWQLETLSALLKDCGFDEVSMYGNMELRSPTEADHRICFVCRNGEGGQLPGQMQNDQDLFEHGNCDQ